MRTWTETHREGTAVGPVDWSHPTAKDMPPAWREAEKNPEQFVFRTSSSFTARQVYEVCMYDGWPYWEPRPAILFAGVLGPEWAFFDSYGVYSDSILRAPR